MIKVNHHKLDSIDDSKLKFVVVQARYKEGWIFVKHKARETWEIPGGHIEKGEDPVEAAKRELFEETGALEFVLYPIEIYSVTIKGVITYGKLFLADVSVIGELPGFEIEEILINKELPKELTYPLIQPLLFEKVKGI